MTNKEHKDWEREEVGETYIICGAFTLAIVCMILIVFFCPK